MLIDEEIEIHGASTPRGGYGTHPCVPPLRGNAKVLFNFAPCKVVGS